MCKIMIKINNHLKVLKSETDMEFKGLKFSHLYVGPHNKLTVTGFSPTIHDSIMNSNI